MNFRSCQFIRKLPDLSIATPNIKELDLRQCGNLVEVHESVGRLDKLESWDLKDCIKLQIFPSSLMMKSLKSFCLSGCIRLAKFPNIPQEMEGLKFLNLIGTAIRELPPSFENLIGLEQLFVGFYFYSGQIISSVHKLQHLRGLHLMGDVKFPEYVEISRRALLDYYDGFSKYGFPSLNDLSLCFTKNCSEIEFILTYCFPLSLQSLSIRNRDLTLPESFIRFNRLCWLDIGNFEFLEEIPKLPESIRGVDASNCIWLNSQSLSKLLLQVSLLKKQFCFPNTLLDLLNFKFLNFLIACSFEKV